MKELGGEIMIFSPFRCTVTGIVIGLVLATLSNDYVIVNRRKYDKLKKEKE